MENSIPSLLYNVPVYNISEPSPSYELKVPRSISRGVTSQKPRKLVADVMKESGARLLFKEASMPMPAYDAQCGQQYITQCFELHELVGQGSFGRVYGARCRANRTFYAVKRLLQPYASESERTNALREVDLMRHCAHPHVLRLFAAWEEDNHLQLALELALYPLDYVMRVARAGLPALTMWRVYTDVMQALGFLHSRHVVHNDVKPGNIVVSTRGFYKLCDFNTAVDLDRVEVKEAMRVRAYMGLCRSVLAILEGDESAKDAEAVDEEEETANHSGVVVSVGGDDNVDKVSDDEEEACEELKNFLKTVNFDGDVPKFSLSAHAAQGIRRRAANFLERHAAATGGVPQGDGRYLPPEMLAGRIISDRVDVYAFGATLLHAATNVLPTSTAQVGSRRDMERSLRLVSDAELARVLRPMLAEDGTQRPSAAQLLDLPLVRQLADEPERPLPLRPGDIELFEGGHAEPDGDYRQMVLEAEFKVKREPPRIRRNGKSLREMSRMNVSLNVSNLNESLDTIAPKRPRFSLPANFDSDQSSD